MIGETFPPFIVGGKKGFKKKSETMAKILKHIFESSQIPTPHSLSPQKK